MTVRRMVPHVPSADPASSRAFYTQVLGLEPVMDMGWIVTWASPANPTAQVIVRQDQGPGPQPAFTVEVSDVDACHARAVECGAPVVYPLTDEPWGVRRFFVREPDGVVINVMSHQPAG